MKIKTRTSDLIVGGNELELLQEVKNFPIYMGCVDSAQDRDLHVDLVWEIGKKSGFIQLKKLIPLEILYKESHNSVIGKIWSNHHEQFAEFIHQYRPNSVFEIGGAHGILAKIYGEKHSIPWKILEPNPNPTEGCSAQFEKGFFSEKTQGMENFDAIVHSHVLEHIYDPCEFFSNLASKMRMGARLIFSVPNMQEMLSRKYTNCLNFEHTIFITEPYIEYLLDKFSFKVLKKQYYMDDHSIFFSAQKIDIPSSSKLTEGLYQINKNLFANYMEYHKNMVAEINKKLSNFKGNVFIFGAHIFSQYLITLGVSQEKLSGVLDNDIKKQGKRLYGTGLRVVSPEILKGQNNCAVILRAGVYNQEIKDQILNTINKNITFI